MKPTAIIIHHTSGTGKDPHADTSSHTVETVNAWHRHRFWIKSSLGYYVGYHYFIEKDGTVTQTRMEEEQGIHTAGYNNQIGICLAGNFDVFLPDNRQVHALSMLLREIHEHRGILKVYPHRAFSPKSCYGYNLPDDWAQSLLNEYLAQKWQAKEKWVGSIIKFLKAFKKI